MIWSRAWRTPRQKPRSSQACPASLNCPEQLTGQQSQEWYEGMCGEEWKALSVLWFIYTFCFFQQQQRKTWTGILWARRKRILMHLKELQSHLPRNLKYFKHIKMATIVCLFVDPKSQSESKIWKKIWSQPQIEMGI